MRVITEEPEEYPVRQEERLEEQEMLRTGWNNTLEAAAAYPFMQSTVVVQKRIAVIDFGGTFSMRPNADGLQESCAEEYLSLVPQVYEHGDISFRQGKRLDSTDMTLEERVGMAKMIDGLRGEVDAVVVVQGTDTLVDTAAALTYMLQGLDIPIVLTGAQKPVFESETDAKRNLELAVHGASRATSGVYIAFDGKLMRGVRAAKQDACRYDAFTSFRDDPLGFHELRVPRTQYRPFTAFDTGVAVYAPPSGMDNGVLKAMLDLDSVTGVVIEGYGMGNVPAYVRDLIPEFHARGKPVTVVTSCCKGGTDRTYATSCADAIPGGELTRIAATQKMSYALGLAKEAGLRGDRRLAFVSDIMRTPIAYDGALAPQTELFAASAVA